MSITVDKLSRYRVEGSLESLQASGDFSIFVTSPDSSHWATCVTEFTFKCLKQWFSTFILSFAPWQISKVKFTPKFIFTFSLLQMPIVIGKSVNFLLAKFTPG